MQRNYVSPKAQDHQDGREQRARQVRDYLKRSTPLTRPSRSTTRWSEFYRAYVEVR